MNTSGPKIGACVLTRVARRLTDEVAADTLAGVDMSLCAYEHTYEPTVIAAHARSECVRTTTRLLSLGTNPFTPTLLYLLSTLVLVLP